MSDERKCHLCGEPTVDKYCINESCAEYQNDETSAMQKRNAEIWDIFREKFTQEERDLIAEYTENEIQIELICNQ